MARRSRVRFSHEHLDIEQIDGHRRDTEAAIESYFATGNRSSTRRFLGLSPSEVRTEKELLLDELRKSSSMDVFGALEAAFRVDYLQRCYRRERDDVSRAFRNLYNDKGPHVSLEGDILVAWRQNSDVPHKVIADLTDAFKYRHWLAHGRYWNPRFRKLDYEEVYTLAEETFDAFPFEEGTG